MSQADERSTTTPSRRALLAGAPTIAAVAMTVGVVGNAAFLGIARAEEAGLDWAAIILRAEGTIDKLRKYYGTSWDAADQESANWLLKYCRDQAADLPEDELTWQLTMDFFEHYNQSLDWVFSGDPVTMIAAEASRSSRGAAGWEAELDPIYGAIEEHRAAVLALNEVDDVHSEMRPGDPGCDAASQASTEASDIEMDALRELVSCQPTTTKGVIALLDHLGQPQFLRKSDDRATVLSGAHEWLDDEEEEEVRTFPHTLAAALRNIVARGGA